MASQRYNKEDLIIEWIFKFLGGIGIGLIINIAFIATKSFYGMDKGFIAGVVLMCFTYGIGFSFGILFLKAAWNRARRTFKKSNAFLSQTSGNFVLAFALGLAALIIGALLAWIIGLALCVADIICAFTGRKLLSTLIREKFGYMLDLPDNINYEQITRDAVRTNYMTHGTPDAGTSNGHGFTPTEEQVEKAAEKKRYDLSYWE